MIGWKGLRVGIFFAFQSYRPGRSMQMLSTFRCRGVFCGSGSDALNIPAIRNEILSLTGKKPSDCNVLYLGTATYDLDGPMMKQTELFREAGASVEILSVADSESPLATVKLSFQLADIVIVSGGNTLYAVDRWKELGIDLLLKDSMERGVILAGGSAGAIVWFDSGHSDSNDPSSFKPAMIEAAKNASTFTEDSLNLSVNVDSVWEYIRVEGLGFLPGLLCPHHDKIQSNGIPRSKDLDSMILLHAGEQAVCIDHWAALIIDGEDYRVISLPDKEGSVLESDGEMQFSVERKGIPGIWIKNVLIDRSIEMKLVPSKGKTSDLFRIATSIIKDKRVEICRKMNPTPLYMNSLP
jgi:dipeptidase E